MQWCASACLYVLFVSRAGLCILQVPALFLLERDDKLAKVTSSLLAYLRPDCSVGGGLHTFS